MQAGEFGEKRFSFDGLSELMLFLAMNMSRSNTTPL
jgi:hypothetical protein